MRLCVDYRRLNAISPQLQMYIEDIIKRVEESKVLSKLDLAKGFYQVVMEDKSRELTTFVSFYGKYQFRRMPFGLKNAPATFQVLMERVLDQCRMFSAAYIDDVLAFSNSWAEHLEHVKCVLHALREAGLTAKPTK